MTKLIVIFSLICVAQTSASFFEHFRGAMHSVHDSFGRLLSDVYSDVSQTVGCTILAVKQVLALDKGFHESSDYNRRCRGQTPQVRVEVPKTHKGNVAYSYIDSINANHELETVEMEFKTETDRLMAISALLKREVDNIPKDLKIKFEFEPEPREPIDSIWRSLKILHDVEHNNKNSAQSSEIHKVLDEALHIMNIKSANTNESDDDKIKIIVKDLEKESKNELTEADDQFSKWEEEEIKAKKKVKINAKKEIKIVVNNEENNKTDPLLAKAIDESSFKVKKNEVSEEMEVTTTTTSEKPTTLSPELEAFQNYVLSQFGPKDDVSKEAAVDAASKLIQDSKYRNHIFDSLAKADSKDLFANTDLFNFDP